MRKTYDKLIRDRIPEIMDEAGVEYELETLSDEAYRCALLAKLVEEAREVADTQGDNVSITTELADLFEVIDAVINTFGVKRTEVLSQQADRRQERGGFEKKLRLLKTDSPR